MPATGTAPTANTAYSITITITTNTNPGSPQVTNINGVCWDKNGDQLRTFSGMGNGASAKEVFGEVIENCPVSFGWAEQQPTSANVTCSAFTLLVTNPNSNPSASPFPQNSFNPTFSPPLSQSGPLLTTTIVNGNATWDYSGTITTQRGSSAPQTLPYDPDLEVDNVDSQNQ